MNEYLGKFEIKFKTTLYVINMTTISGLGPIDWMKITSLKISCYSPLIWWDLVLRRKCERLKLSWTSRTCCQTQKQ